MTTLADLRALMLVLEERSRQDSRWGLQNHADGTSSRLSIVGHLSDLPQHASNARLRHAVTERCDRAGAHGNATWEKILTEEWAEVCAADTPAEVEAEVAQVAAVGLAWLGAIERRAPHRAVRVYVSGPISGCPGAESAFAAEARRLEAAGYEAINPWDVGPHEHPGEACPPGYHPGSNAGSHQSSACFMRADLLALLSCDALHLLPGWENSRGACVELAVAQACGMAITAADGAVSPSDEQLDPRVAPVAGEVLAG